MPDRYPEKRSSAQQLNRFLQQAERLPARTSSARRGRLIFALDATASRQPTWDRACQLQAEMFQAVRESTPLVLQLCYYRGFNEFHASAWLGDSTALLQQMTGVQCLGGHTQIQRLLRHALQEHRQQRVAALVFVGDALEEAADDLCRLAGEAGMNTLPLLLFQEGHDPAVETVFRQMARLSRGAYARFDQNSAATLTGLLQAAAVFASSGLEGLRRLSHPEARQLLEQLTR